VTGRKVPLRFPLGGEWTVFLPRSYGCMLRWRYDGAGNGKTFKLSSLHPDPLSSHGSLPAAHTGRAASPAGTVPTFSESSAGRPAQSPPARGDVRPAPPQGWI